MHTYNVYIMYKQTRFVMPLPKMSSAVGMTVSMLWTGYSTLSCGELDELPRTDSTLQKERREREREREGEGEGEREGERMER